MRIFHYYPFILITKNLFFIFIGYRGFAHLRQMPEIDRIVQHLLDDTSVPAMKSVLYAVLLLIKTFCSVIARNEYSVYGQVCGYLSVAHSSRSHFKNSLYDFGGFRIHDRQTIFSVAYNISVGGDRRGIFPCFRVRFFYRTNLFRSIRTMPLVEYVHYRHHIHCRAVFISRVDIVG